MATLPAQTRNYHSRVNIPFDTNNTSQIIQESYYAWGLYSCLTNQNTTGSTGGTRHANSTWIVRGSSDASTGSAISAPGVAGTDRWGGATFSGSFTRGSNSTSHHWVLMENTSLGQELLINMSQNAGYLTVSTAITGTFSGGTVLACPSASNTSAPVQLDQTAYSSGDGGQFYLFLDTTNTGLTNYLHFTCADTGEFWFGMSRAGLGIIFNWISLWKSTGQHVSDNVYNIFLLSSRNTYTRAGLGGTYINGTGFCASRHPNGAQKNNGGILQPYTNSVMVADLGIDSLSGQYNSFPCEIMEYSPTVCRRGSLPDIYQIGTATPGSSIPDSANQIRTVAGGLIIPCIGTPIIL